jgi:hypothetical protein
MADKLEWLNKHLVLIRHITVADTVEKENYKIRPDLEQFFTGVSSAEQMAFKFAGLEDYKSACELLCYIAHRRAEIWWAYRCVNSLLAELEINPAVDRDIADIATSFEMEVPDFAKVEPPKPTPEQKADMEATVAEMQAEYEKARAMVDPEIMKLVEDAQEVAFQQFKTIHGIHPLDLLKKLVSRVAEDPYPIDYNSPIFKATDELKAKLQTVRKETVDAIKSVIPPKVPAHEEKVRDNAMNAVYRWVAAPDSENSQKCLDMGNECPDTPAGLLSLSAFWAYGDLLPMGEQTVPTPMGLAANGLCQVLLMCALHKGGTRKLRDRYELYFNLGVDVLTGKDNWGDSLATGKMPHEEIPSEASPQTAPQAPPAADQPGATPPVAENGAPPAPSPGIAEMPSYKRWKPNGGTE